MSAILFAGPSLPVADRPNDPRLTWRPPVSQGDLLGPIEQGVTAIAIIDGYFEAVPAVLHKEILLAMESGIAVVGGASMGALRAAELAPFGMLGVGAIFEDFASGRLTDDDEVAVLHGPEEAGYPALSDAMVDIRATIEAALAASAIDSADAEQATAEAKAAFYKRRRIAELRDGARLLPFRVERKRRDAQAVVAKVQALLDGREAAAGSAAERGWQLAWTDAFETVYRSRHGILSMLEPLERQLLDEIRLEPALYAELRDQTLLDGAALHGLGGAPPASAEALMRWRRDFFARERLWEGRQQAVWLDAHAADARMLDRLAAMEAALDDLRRSPPTWFWRALLDRLRRHPAAPALLAQARAKLDYFQCAVLGDLVAEDEGIDRSGLKEYFFADIAHMLAPIDVESWIVRNGFMDDSEFHHVVLMERIWRERS